MDIYLKKPYISPRSSSSSPHLSKRNKEKGDNKKNNKKDNQEYKPNMHTIKIQPKSKNENGFLKDNLNEPQKILVEKFIFSLDQKIDEKIDILEENKKKLREHEDFFNKMGYVLTDKLCERLAMLIHYILSGIPVLLEGPTGTSKTRTAIIACEYITKIKIKTQNMMIHY